jgi:hypothetical protein
MRRLKEKQMEKFLFFIILGFALAFCEDQNKSNNDKVKAKDKDGTIEPQLSVEHILCSPLAWVYKKAIR